jgi:hypothetical protein
MEGWRRSVGPRRLSSRRPGALVGAEDHDAVDNADTQEGHRQRPQRVVAADREQRADAIDGVDDARSAAGSLRMSLDRSLASRTLLQSTPWLYVRQS